jgi:hypothetical protein
VVEPRGKLASMPLTVIPSYPDLPMEKVYPRQGDSGIAAVYLQEHAIAQSAASGRVVYLPSDLDRTFWEVLAEDHLKLLRNIVEWATQETPAVEVSGAGLVDVVAWNDREAIVVHLVNLTNPMAMKGPYREFVPVGQQQVKLRLPQNLKAQSAKLLVAEKEVAINHSDGVMTVTVSSILDHEIVVIDL